MKKNENEEEIETLDFDMDEAVSNQIDEMLDFVDISTPDTTHDNKQLESLLSKTSDEKKLEIETPKEKLDEFTPSVKDFNIKNAKTKKIVKKTMLYIIIVMLLGFEFFINNTGKALNELRVYASDNQPIKITQNGKYGYIDYTGNKIISPKYVYAEDFVKGYAIVKNSSNLPLIIDKGGKEIISTGNYFSLYRTGSDIIASKVTKKGLKYGILNEDLKEKVSFSYDSISYEGDVYTYIKENTVGLINLKGKEIYKYKLTNTDNKKIEVSSSKITDNDSQKYGVVKVNSSSFIVNLNDGVVVYNPTLNELTAEENNVFSEVSKTGDKKYIYVQDNKVLLESNDYADLKMNSIKTGVLKAIKSDFSYEFISTKTLEQLKKGLSIDDTYYGENVFAYNDHNYKKNTNSIVLVKQGEAFKNIASDFTIEKEYKNGIAIVKYGDGTYGYLNENGDLINDSHYIEAGSFDSYGEAVAKTKDGYGIINKDGKIIIDFNNKEIKMASALVKKKSAGSSNNIFYAVMKDYKYELYNKKGKKVNKILYSEVSFDDDYPILKISTDSKDTILFSDSMKEVNLTAFNTEYKSFENYIIVKNEYYNYKGKLIYVDNSEKESGD